MPHSCHLPPQSSLLGKPSLGSEATGTASVLTVCFLLSVPTDDPIWQCMWSTVRGDIPETVQLKRDSSIITGHKEVWVLLTTHYWLLPVYYRPSRYLEVTCILWRLYAAKGFTFERCFSYHFVKSHPNIYWNSASNIGKEQRKREDE